MNDIDRANCYSAEEEFMALDIPADVENRIERAWISGNPERRATAVDLLVVHAPTYNRQSARSLLRRMYRA